ncbi:MAG: DoxX family protein [Bacteroidetes bacterium]|nr:DoxX family protein [Bacteroidota bacterium]
MKKTNLLYWIFTVLFAGMMLFTAIPSILHDPNAAKFMSDLHYPDYFVQFISYAKVLGAVALLVPGFHRIKEWAYAGLFFDLIGALYSLVSVFGFKVDNTFLALPFALGILSYYFYHKKLKASA